MVVYALYGVAALLALAPIAIRSGRFAACHQRDLWRELDHHAGARR